MRTPQAPARRPTPLEEWAIVTDRVSKDPEAFIRFLNERIRRVGDCRLWSGRSTGTQYGYRTVSMWYDGQQFLVYVHRLFLTLMLRHPIPEGFHASHDHAVCPHTNCVFHLYLEHRSDNCRESATRMNRARKETH